MNWPRRGIPVRSSWTDRPGKSGKRWFEVEGGKHNLHDFQAGVWMTALTVGVRSMGKERKKGFH